MSLSLKPRLIRDLIRDMIGVIAIQLISNLTVAGNALQGH
jgi:hypothetical protein